MPSPRRQPAASDPPPLPGGYKVGEKVFYTGVNKTFPSGNKLVHGQQGEVTGPATGSLEGKAVELRFPGNKGNVDCYCYLVERMDPGQAKHETAQTCEGPYPQGLPLAECGLLGCTQLSRKRRWVRSSDEKAASRAAATAAATAAFVAAALASVVPSATRPSSSS